MKRYLSVLLSCLGYSLLAQDLTTLSQQKPLTFHGGITMRTMFYHAEGIANRRQPFSYLITGSPTLSLYGFSIPFTFIVSEQERSFRQPFNQFGLSPSYKWITLHGGYRNVSFSPFTLDGYTMLGGGVELRPGKWHIGLMYGRLNRAVVANQSLGDLQAVSFNRRGVAGKIGYGSDTTHVEFSFIKAKDNAASVDYQNIGQDTLGVVPVTPAENLVMSLGGRVGLLKYFFVEAEGAVSIYTKNIRSSMAIDSTVAHIPAWLPALMTINSSTENNKALRGAIGYRQKKYGFSLQYRRIDPNYQSMGAYFFQNDLENITLNPMALLWQGKIRFNGSLGIQRDNLSGQKQATARRVIGSLNASLALSGRFGIEMAYSNFATSQTPIAVKFNDSLRVAQTTQNFSFTPHYFILGTSRNHVFTLSVNYMTLNDLSLLSQQRNVHSTNAFFNYQITFQATGLNLSAGLSYARLQTAMLTSGNQGLTLGVGKSLLHSKLTLRLNSSILQNLQGTAQTMLYTNGLSGSYRATKRHSLNLTVNYIQNQESAESQQAGGYPTFTEVRGDVGYNFTF
ncbi:hypothetical protein QNI16_34335 [Cytophagaceae bacterium YF14B1]|uniref:DUF5723 domain-containing protein n=1 Tax=Xanthocytophaga flava TaxID=3048013 RepID=A0AAE3QYQ8_9BACT|nr:hypothetical protein [Xanthocytophaga flavus]MDJ1485620.1 hypothetical protein [Xanthocytophaga flavus]